MITLIRHGESHANVDGKLYEHYVDAAITLTHKGVTDTLVLAKSDTIKTHSRFFCSPELRATQTALIIADVMKKLPHPLPLQSLVEISSAVTQEEMPALLTDPLFVPRRRKQRVTYCHPSWASWIVSRPFTQCVIDAIGFYQDDTLIVSHNMRIRSIIAAHWVVDYFLENGEALLNKNSLSILQRAFGKTIPNTTPFIVNVKHITTVQRQQILRACSWENLN